MKRPRRYYFDADVLILLDKCNLVGKMECFKRRAGSELIITPTIKNELVGMNCIIPCVLSNTVKSVC